MNGLNGIRTNEVGNEIIDNTVEEDALARFRGKSASNTTGYADANINGIRNQFDLRSGNPLADYGQSKYDIENGAMFDPTFEKIQDNRFERQSGLTQIGAGLAKGVVTAGTTFVDGIGMLTVGIAQGIYNKLDEKKETRFLDGLWNNAVTQAMQGINEWSEDVFKNYYSTNQQTEPWYSKDNILSANFLGDKILKNMGFMVGAYGSGAVLTAGKMLPKTIFNVYKGIGGASKSAYRAAKSVAALEGSAISAISEGGIEALNNSTAWKKEQLTELNDKIAFDLQELNSIKDYMSEESYNIKLQEIENRKRLSEEKIEADAIKMGNIDLLCNLPILTAENVFAWGKLYSSGFKGATRFGSEGIIRNGATNEGKNAIENIINSLESKVKKPPVEGAKRTLKRSAAEGHEEIAQAWASEFSGIKMQQDVDNYYDALVNNKNYEETYDNWKAAVEAWHNTYGNGDQWEEFAIGAISSVFGMPKVRGVKNSETGKWQSPISFQGGIVNDLREARQEKKDAENTIKYLKDRLNDPKFVKTFEGLQNHNYWQNVMDKAAEIGDKKTYKDAEVKQFVNDLFMLHKAGILENAESIIKTMGDIPVKKDEEYTDEENKELDLIKENDKIKDENGKVIGSQRGWFSVDKETGKVTQEKTNSEIAKEVNDRKNKLLGYIDNYKQALEEIDYQSNGEFTDEQLTELAWAKMLSYGNRDRSGDILNTTKVSDDYVSQTTKPNISNIKTALDERLDYLLSKKSPTEEDQKEIEELRAHQSNIEKFSETDFSGMTERKQRKLNRTLNDGLNSIRKMAERFNVNDQFTIDALRNLNDAVALLNSSDLYDKRYQEYIDNPGMLHEQIEEKKEQAENDRLTKQAEQIAENLSQYDNLNDFEKALDESLSGVLDEDDIELSMARWNKLTNKLKETNNPKVKQMLQRLENKRSINKAIDNVISNGIEESEEYSKLPQETKDKVNNDLAELTNRLKDFETSDDVKKELISFVESKKAEGLDASAIEHIEKVANAINNELNKIETSKKVNNSSKNTKPQEPVKPQEETTEETEDSGSEVEGENQQIAEYNHSFGLSVTKNFTANKKLSAIVEAEKNFENSKTADNYEAFKNAVEDLLNYLKDNKSKEFDYWNTIFNTKFSQYENQIVQETPANDENVSQQTLTEDEHDGIQDDEKITEEEKLQRRNAAIDSIEENKQQSTGLISTVRNWINTLFNYNDLMSGDRKVTIYKKDAASQAVQEFIDRGALADLNTLWKNLHNKPLPIRFIINPNKSYDTKSNRPDLLLAIESTPEIEKYINNYYKRAVDSEEINGKKYIFVGKLGFYSNDRAKENPSQKLFMSFVNPIMDEYNNANKPDLFVSEYTTEVQHFYSGRIALSDETHSKAERNIIDTEFGTPENLVIGIGRSDGSINAPQIANEEIKTLNVNNPTAFRAGSVWLMVKGADGIWYPMGCQMKRFNETEYNWKDHTDSPIIKKMLELAAILTDPNRKESEYNDAKIEFTKLLAFPVTANGERHIPIVYDRDENTGQYRVSINPLNKTHQNSVNLNKETGQQLESQEAIESFMNALMSCNYRFGVSKLELAKSNNKDYLNMLIESNIMTTDLLYNRNFGGSFDMDKMYDKDGKVVAGYETPQETINASNTSSINSTIETLTLSIASKGIMKFQVDSDGNITSESGVELNQSEKDAVNAVNALIHGQVTGLVEYNGIFYSDGKPFIIERSGQNAYTIHTNDKRSFNSLKNKWESLKLKPKQNESVQQQILEQVNEAVSTEEQTSTENNSLFNALVKPTETKLPEISETVLEQLSSNIRNNENIELTKDDINVLKELSTYFTLTPDMSIDKLNDLLEQAEKCKHMAHKRIVGNKKPPTQTLDKNAIRNMNDYD